MNWSDLAKTVIGLGAPLIGQALGGPLAGADPSLAATAAAKAEAEWAEALAQIGKSQVEQVGLTQRAEMMSGDILQRWWRPIYALELSLLECPGFTLTLLHALWTGNQAGINGFASLTGLLMAYFAARFGVLGVYVSGRSREKQCLATGQPVPGIVDTVTRAVTRGR